MSFEPLPGSEYIQAGIDDLNRRIESIPALLVSIGAPRLRRLGLPVPNHVLPSPEHKLYERLRSEDADGAHPRYNALIRKLVSFERAAECGKIADAERIRRFMRALCAEAESPARIYLNGGATAVLLGWRASTIDVDIRIFPESDRLCRAIPALKDSLEINIEFASPADFIPELPGWGERSIFVVQEGRLSFYHYDLYAQVLAKIERSHTQDLADVKEMIRRNLVDPGAVLRYFQEIEPRLYLYPAIDPASFRRAVEGILEDCRKEGGRP
jgi:hypothetical protein